MTHGCSPFLLIASMWVFQSSPTFHVNVETVSVTFGVMDRHGALVPNLQKRDFEVWENRIKQEIVGFSTNEDTPLILGLVLDRSGTQAAFFLKHIQAIKAFINQTVRSTDSLFTAVFQDDVRLLTDWGATLPKVANALDTLQTNTSADIYSSLPLMGISGRPTGASAVYDAVYYCCLKMRYTAGRRALIVFTDGADNASRHTRDDAIRIAQETDTVVIPIMYISGRMLLSNILPAELWNNLSVLAEETGGNTMGGSDPQLAATLQKATDYLRSMYELAYVSSDPVNRNKFREIQIKAKLAGAQIQARKGYWK